MKNQLLYIFLLATISFFAQNNGDYRSVSGSNQDFSIASTWEIFNGSS